MTTILSGRGSRFEKAVLSGSIGSLFVKFSVFLGTAVGFFRFFPLYVCILGKTCYLIVFHVFFVVGW